MSTPFILVIIFIAGYAIYGFSRVHRKQDEVIKTFQEQLNEMRADAYYEVHITLNDQEEIFLDGKERTYSTPHGILHVYPDPQHVAVVKND